AGVAGRARLDLVAPGVHLPRERDRGLRDRDAVDRQRDVGPRAGVDGDLQRRDAVGQAIRDRLGLRAGLGVGGVLAGLLLAARDLEREVPRLEPLAEPLARASDRGAG